MKQMSSQLRSNWKGRKMSKIKKAALPLLIVTLLLTGCGSDGVFEKHSRNYDAITDVEGISFDVPDGLADFATAVSEISDEVNFESNGTYVYKEMGEKYFLFNMESIVVAAQKGSGFAIGEQDRNIEESVTGTDMFGIWFTRTGKKKLSYEIEENKNGTYKMIADVNASVSLTKNLYDDFRGQLAVMSDGSEEWAVFVGIREDDYEEASKATIRGVSHMLKSVNFYDNTKQFVEDAVVVGEAETESTIAETEETIATETKEEVLETEGTLEDVPPTEVTEETNETVTEDSVQETERTSMPQTDMEEETAETKEAEDETEIAVDEEKAENGSEKKTIQLNNQHKTKKKDDVAYSTVYSTLQEGNAGYADVYSKDDKCMKELVVTLNKVYRTSDATSLLQEELGDAFMPASAGTTWQAASFSIRYPDEEKLYLNSLFTGMDGDNLRYRGIKYSKKTKEFVRGEEHFIYYLVPNGCTEYLLKFGDSSVTGAHSVYYRIPVEE